MRDDRYRWFRTELLGIGLQPQTFIFRGMNKRESVLYDIKMNESPFKGQQYALETCVAEQIPWGECPAGSAATLVELIQERSVGYSPKMWEEANEFLSSHIGIREAMACAVLPSVDFHLLETCDAKYYAQYILFGTNLFSLIYPEHPLLKYLEGDQGKSEGGFGKTITQAAAVAPGQVGQETTTFTWSK